MCVRYSLVQSKEKIAQRFGIEINQDFKQRYNVAPMQTMPVITNKNSEEASFFKWGLVPMWSTNESVALNLINAKAETVFTKVPFKQCVKTQRCLVMADGYYEWKREGKQRIPYRITLSSDELFAFAGIWDSWETPTGDILNTYSIITTPTNSLLKEINDRMPVILPKEIEKDWLSNSLQQIELEELLLPYDGNKMSYYKTHKTVNSPEYDLPECIQVAPKIYPGETFSLFD